MLSGLSNRGRNATAGRGVWGVRESSRAACQKSLKPFQSLKHNLYCRILCLMLQLRL